MFKYLNFVLFYSHFLCCGAAIAKKSYCYLSLGNALVQVQGNNILDQVGIGNRYYLENNNYIDAVDGKITFFSSMDSQKSMKSITFPKFCIIKHFPYYNKLYCGLSIGSYKSEYNLYYEDQINNHPLRFVRKYFIQHYSPGLTFGLIIQKTPTFISFYELQVGYTDETTINNILINLTFNYGF